MSSLKTTFLTGPLGPIYARTALPIIFVMGMNGLLAAADALFFLVTSRAAILGLSKPYVFAIPMTFVLAA